MHSKKALILLSISTAALAAHGASAQEAAVQDAGQQVVAQAIEAELPAIVVEGATIAAKPVAKAKPKPAPVMVEEAPPPPSATPKKVKKAAKAKPAQAAPAAAIEPVAGAAEGAAAAAEISSPSTFDTANGGDTLAAIPSDKIGTAVSVVTGEQLRQRQVRNGAEAIRSLPGVLVSRSGGSGGLTQVRLRGAEGNHTLVLIDGVEANDTFNGEFDFSDLATEDIEQIEVLRGPQSGLYGSGAIGGVINIVTRSGRGPLTFRAMGEAGSFATYGGAASVSGGNDRVWGALSMAQRRTGGYNISREGDEEDGAQLKTFNIRAGAQVLPGVALDLSLRHTNREADRDDQIYEPPFFISDGLQHDTNSRLHETAWLGSVKLTWESLDGALTQVAKATRNETQRVDNAFTGTTTDNLGLRKTYSYAATYRLDTPALLGAHHAFTGHAEHEREAFTPRSDFGFGFAADGIERSRALDAAAFEYRGEFADRLFLQGTVRHDESNVFGGYNTWRTSASLALPEVFMRPHASYGTGLKLPTMFENFGSIPGSFYANPDLQPEESKGWDAGVEFTLWPGRATVDVTYFDNIATNKIRAFQNCRPAPPPFFQECTSANVAGDSPRNGIEVDGRFALGYGVSLGLAYTFTDAEDPSGRQEIRRAAHSARGDIGYAFDGGRGNLNLSAHYVADNLDTNFGDFSTVTLDPYWLVNVAASYKLQPGVEVFGRVENALDQRYEEVFGFDTAGVAVYGGMRFTYEEPSTAGWVKYR